MTKNLLKIVYKILVFSFIWSVFHFACYSQQNLEPFSSKLENKEKKIIKENIKRLTKYIRQEDWSSVYDWLLLDPQQKGSKAEFIRTEQEYARTPRPPSRVVRFKATNFLIFDDERFNENVQVLGCMTVIKNRVKKKYWGAVELKRIGTRKWYFVSLPYENPGLMMDGPKPC